MFIAAVITVPFLLIAACSFVRNPRLMGLLNCLGYALLFGAGAFFLKDFSGSGYSPLSLWGWAYVDSLSAFFLLTTAVVGFGTSLYSIGYICAEAEEGKVSTRKVTAYYQLFNLFMLAMFAVPLLNNLALVWIAVEMTTLISAFLVGFHNVKESIEAAWKYIIICSVGITFALLGVIFFYYTSSKDAGVKSLEWVSMLSGSGSFDPRIIRIALVFIFVGYGTKAGLAPMHNWLPDAHSQALSPVSGLLSGVLLKISIYAILRFVILANLAVGYAYSAKLFLFFGLFSLAVASIFILVQKDLKRLLAYSSVENIGLVSLGLGLGPWGGVFAGLLHAFNHAVTKPFLFFCAGEAVRAYHTNSMNKMRGFLSVMPFTAGALLLGFCALSGMPPFSIFISKLLILVCAFQSGYYLLAAAILSFIALAFAGMLYHISRVAFGNASQGLARQREPASLKAALLFLGIFMLTFGLNVPQAFLGLLNSCQQLILSR